MTKSSEIDYQILISILPSLRPYFDFITLENSQKWIMKIRYGHKEIFESFETYELDPQKEEDEFYAKKIRLFQDGVALYQVINVDEIILACKVDNEEYYTFR